MSVFEHSVSRPNNRFYRHNFSAADPPFYSITYTPIKPDMELLIKIKERVTPRRLLSGPAGGFCDGNSGSRYSLRSSRARKTARIHHRGRAHPGARHRTERRHFFPV